MTGVKCIPEKPLAHEIERYGCGDIRSIMAFGVSHHLDETGSGTWNENGLVPHMAHLQRCCAGSGGNVRYLLL
jgi:porphobilinogen synthase